MMHKKLIISFLSLACNVISYAGTSNISALTTCNRENVTIPCEQQLWDLGIQALYLQPSFGSELAYLPTTLVQGTNPDGNWGYKLEGSYYFSTGADVNLNWSHYDGNTNPSNFFGQFPFPGIGFIAAPFQLNLNTKYDQVNLVLGQITNVGLTSNAHFYAGFQYASFKVDESSTFVVPANLLPLTAGPVFDKNIMDFSGAGPVLGLHLAHGLTSRLSINANTQGSLIYGTTRFSMATALNSGIILRSLYGSQKILVPSVEAKIGANYAYPMLNGILNFEGGYQAINYFSPLDVAPSLNFLGKADLGMFGPYLGLRWLAVA